MNSKPRPWPLRLAAAAGAVLAVWSLISRAGEAAAGGWQPAGFGVASYLQQGPNNAWASSFGGGTGRGHLPTSVLPFTPPGTICSVDTTDPGSPPSCSTTTAAGRCSAHCDNAQRCSAFLVPGAGPEAQCSARGGNGRRCSVLQPMIQPAGPSACSAFGGPPNTRILCSVIGVGNNQACSAENPQRIGPNQCSTFPSGGAVGGTHQCSVLFGGPNTKNYCSVGGDPGTVVPSKQCTTFAPNSSCSVNIGSRGFCTNFAPAPVGSCSVFAAPSHCSVIGGPAGIFCRWP